MALDPYTELRKQPLRKYVTPSDFDQLKQFLTFDKQVSDRGTAVGLFISKCDLYLLAKGLGSCIGNYFETLQL